MSRFLSRIGVGAEAYGSALALGLEEGEAEVMADEAAQDQAEITEDMNSVNRAVDLSDGLEDIAAIAEQTIADGEPTESEAALINAAANMAVAGSDDSAEELVPAVEARQRIGVESIRERAADIWRSIQEFLKKIWAKIESWVYKIVGNVPRLRRKVEAMRKRVEGLDNKTKKEKNFSLSAGLRSLSLTSGVVKNASGLIGGLETAKNVAEYAFVAAPARVKTLGESLQKAYEAFDAEKPSLFSVAVKDAVQGIANVPSGWGTDDRFGDFNSKKSPELLGGKCVIARTPKDVSGDAVLGQLELARRTRVEMVNFAVKEKSLPSEVSFETMSSADILKVCDIVDKLANGVEDYSRGKAFKDMKQTRDKIETSARKVVTEWDKKANETNDDGAKVTTEIQRAIMKSALGFNVTYLNLVKEPAGAMVGYVVSLCHVALAICDKSISQYKVA